MMRNAVAVTATPDKSKSNWTAQAQAFSEDESDAILQSYLLDGECVAVQ